MGSSCDRHVRVGERKDCDAGVDVLCFGATKIGALAGEAVVILNPDGVSGEHVDRRTVRVPTRLTG